MYKEIMNTELTEKLYTKYPNLFKQRTLPETDSLMCFGLECSVCKL